MGGRGGGIKPIEAGALRSVLKGSLLHKMRKFKVISNSYGAHVRWFMEEAASLSVQETNMRRHFELLCFWINK